MQLAGLDRNSENPPGGELVRDARGELTGLLRETAQRAVSAAMAADLDQRSDEEKAKERLTMVELAGHEALSKGVTSFHDAGVDFDTIDYLKELEAAGKLPIRLYSMVRFASNDEMAEKLPLYRSTAEQNDFMTVRSIKRQIDGALGAHGAWLLEPYEDLPSSVGLVLEPEEEIERTVELALEHGYQVNTHAIGDRANRVVLDIYQRAGVSSDQRFRIEHAQHVDPEDLPRFAGLGVIASVQGVHCTSDGPWIPRRLGEERTERTSYRWRDMIDSGALVTNGTDVPVEDIDPIASYYASVGRVMPDGSLFHPGQKMSREEALRSYTINNAYASFEEASKGSIEVGKLADMVVLSKDILTVAVEEIPQTLVEMTVVGGDIAIRKEIGRRSCGSRWWPVTVATSDLGIGPWAFERGLHDLGNGSWAWLQPDGGWGWSNAGLIVDSGESLLVDTLFDLPKTQEMLDAMRASVPASKEIGTLVNTHSNGDHTHGNELVEGAEIVASAACATEMEAALPERLAAMMRMAREEERRDEPAAERLPGRLFR